MNKRVNKLMSVAKKLSYKSTYKYKIGCAIARGNEIVGLGFNNPYKTHPKSNSRFQNIHAELSAILNARKENLNDCVAYLYRESKDGEPMIARPCKFCMELLKKVGIKEVVYTDTTKGIEKEVL